MEWRILQLLETRKEWENHSQLAEVTLALGESGNFYNHDLVLWDILGPVL